MEVNAQNRLSGAEIHGFHTIQDLDVGTVMVEAKARWLRPNEIHAILCNDKYFTVNVKPVNLPKSGTIVLFDRKMLRNFRKDGYSWKKKKDGKTIKEAHEHLKVGNEERIHVYYAHGEDNPTFVRRCYWLLEKSLEHIVLVHYRETQEVSPDASVNSNCNPALSDPSTSFPLLEELDSSVDRGYFDCNKSPLGRHDKLTVKNHEQRLHEINTLEWDELLGPDDSRKLNLFHDGRTSGHDISNQYHINSCRVYDDTPLNGKVSPESSASYISGQFDGSHSINYNIFTNVNAQTLGSDTFVNSRTVVTGLESSDTVDSLKNLGKNILHTQDSIGKWMSYMIADSPESVNDQVLESSISAGHQSVTSQVMDGHSPSVLGQIFHITKISPAWATVE